MPMTKGTKLAKGEKAGSKKPNKPNAISCDAEKIISGNDNSHYVVDCGKAVPKSQAGISCDICGFGTMLFFHIFKPGRHILLKME